MLVPLLSALFKIAIVRNVTSKVAWSTSFERALYCLHFCNSEYVQFLVQSLWRISRERSWVRTPAGAGSSVTNQMRSCKHSSAIDNWYSGANGVVTVPFRQQFKGSRNQNKTLKRSRIWPNKTESLWIEQKKTSQRTTWNGGVPVWWWTPNYRYSSADSKRHLPFAVNKTAASKHPNPSYFYTIEDRNN